MTIRHWAGDPSPLSCDGKDGIRTRVGGIDLPWGLMYGLSVRGEDVVCPIRDVYSDGLVFYKHRRLCGNGRRRNEGRDRGGSVLLIGSSGILFLFGSLC